MEAVKFLTIPLNEEKLKENSVESETNVSLDGNILQSWVSS